MQELIAALEAATGPDRELDARILIAADRKRALRLYWTGATGIPRDLPDDWNMLKGGLGSASIRAMAPEYTSSVDASLTLVPEGYLPEITSGKYDGTPHYSMLLWASKDRGQNIVGHNSLAIAICIAALKARGAQ